MPDGNPLASLYPQPVQPQAQQSTLLSDPARLVGLLGQIQQIQQSKQAFAAKTAQGGAAQSALNPDGTIDFNKYSAGLKAPAAAYGGQEAVGSMLDQRNRQIANSSDALGLGIKNNQSAAGIIGALAQKPNPTMEDVYNAQAAMARAGVDPATVSAWGAGTNPKNIKDRLGLAANYAMGPAAAASTQAGPVGPNGEPTTITTGSRAFGGPTIQTGLSPIQEADQKEYLADQTKSAATLANVRPLEQALPLIQKLAASNFGPGSPELAQLKGLLVTAGVMDPNSSSLPTRQDAQKLLNQYVTQSPSSGRSDMALSQEKISRPNFDLTQPANIALIKNQIGMDKMDAALPLAAGKAAGYKDVKSKYYQGNDPRAFAINTYTPDEIADLQKSLKGADREKFNRSLQIAIKSGIVTPPSAPEAPQ